LKIQTLEGSESMDVFKKYADFYDQLYEDKDYKAECDFIEQIFEEYGIKEIASILDLGCGTGSHAIIFAENGYDVTGVDQSETMLNIARAKASIKNKDVKFKKQDIRHLDLPQKFDAAVAMFAVMGYLTSNKDFEDALISDYNHLSSGGLFVFDVWFGPTVLMDKPQERLRRIESSNRKIFRFAHPVLDVIHHTVEVNYTILEITDQEISEISEHHLMRYFFYQEIAYLLEKNGFKLLQISPFMDLKRNIDESCWNIVVICEKDDSQR